MNIIVYDDLDPVAYLTGFIQSSLIGQKNEPRPQEIIGKHGI